MLTFLQTAVTAEGSVAALDKVQELIQQLTNWGISTGKQIIAALIIFLVGRLLISVVNKLVAKLLSRRNVDAGVQSFVKSFVNILLTILLIVAIVNKLGVDTTSFAALLASAGVAVGMALSGNLQNFAGGLIILLFRPFKVGDFIEAQGVAGTVKEIQIFNTVVHTGDNKVILLPNGPVSTGIINNYSRAPLRRVDFTFSISYGDDFNKAKEVLLALVAEDERVLTEPAAPFVELGALAASSIDLTVRLWCKQEDYWKIKFDLNRKVYETFPKHGLNFPYQTFTVNVTKE